MATEDRIRSVTHSPRYYAGQRTGRGGHQEEGAHRLRSEEEKRVISIRCARPWTFPIFPPLTLRDSDLAVGCVILVGLVKTAPRVGT
jgi:hypothetical protein